MLNLYSNEQTVIRQNVLDFEISSKSSLHIVTIEKEVATLPLVLGPSLKCLSHFWVVNSNYTKTFFSRRPSTH